MPNWCYNTLTIQGPKSEVDMIKDRLNKPFTLAQETYGMGDISSSGFPTKIKQVEYNNPVFAFFNIHSYKDDGITDEEYACQPSRGDIDMKNDPDWFKKSIEFAKTQKDWYSWNNSNWGTKWDVAVRDDEQYSNTELLEYKSEGDDNWVIYKYETAWSHGQVISITPDGNPNPSDDVSSISTSHSSGSQANVYLVDTSSLVMEELYQGPLTYTSFSREFFIIPV